MDTCFCGAVLRAHPAALANAGMLWNMLMSHADTPRRHTSGHKFVRIVGLLWLGVVLVILAGALVAPYVGRIADVILHYTAHRHWTLLTLHPAHTFVDFSSPAHTVKSYYSALYRGDGATMDRLTIGPFRDQMRLRVVHAEAVPPQTTYRSYLNTEVYAPHLAVVREKFHLFWQRGLHFHLERSGTDWQIVRVELVQ